MDILDRSQDRRRGDDLFIYSMSKELGDARDVSADSGLSCAWHGVAESQQHSRVTVDNGSAHVHAAQWATGVLEPTTSQVENGNIEEDNIDEGMPEPRLEPQVPEGVGRSNIPNVQVLFYLHHTSDMRMTRKAKRGRCALGMRRRHVKLTSESTNVMYADLSGPHPQAVGNQLHLHGRGCVQSTS